MNNDLNSSHFFRYRLGSKICIIMKLIISNYEKTYTDRVTGGCIFEDGVL